MKHLNVNGVVEWVSTVCPHPNLPPAKPGTAAPIPRLPPAQPGEGVYFPLPLGEGPRERATHSPARGGAATLSSGFAGGGSGWGQAIDGEFDR
jgi:hypothetical protein